MSGFRDHFGDHAGDYARARPGYPTDLFVWLAQQSKGHEIVWDCATGSGQAAAQLTAHYRQVVATDASCRQLRAAWSTDRVTYMAASAEATPLASGCADLITVAQALHWFDTDAFFREATRVLRPGGLLAIWSYGLCRVTPAIDVALRVFHDERLRLWWPRERWWVVAGYPGLRLPFPMLSMPTFVMERYWRLEDMLAYVATWSGIKRAQRAGESPIDELAVSLRPLWRREIRVVWPLVVRVARKPTPRSVGPEGSCKSTRSAGDHGRTNRSICSSSSRSERSTR